jgi:hypothetical protein
MIPTPPNGHGASAEAVKAIALPAGFVPTWAGPFHSPQFFCVGSEDGRVVFSKKDGSLTDSSQLLKEAINGVAVVGKWMAVTSAIKVVFFPLLRGDRAEESFPLIFLHGAHGVKATASGYFIAPLGRNGVMVISPPFNLGKGVTTHASEQEDFYIYRAECIVAENKREVLICAARLGGLAAAEFSGSDQTHVLNAMSLDNFDVVDFCQLIPESNNSAVAALGRDGTISLSRNVLTDKKPQAIKFQTIEGVAYRVLACCGDIYVLTSQALYMIPDLATRFLAGELGRRINTQILVMPMDAIDANLCGEEWMLVVTTHGLQRLNVRVIHEWKPGSAAEAEFTESESQVRESEWTWGRITQRSAELVG